MERRRPPSGERPQPPEEELAVEMFDLASGAARASTGLEVRLLSGAPQWAFQFDHHGRKSTVNYAGSPLYVEGVLFGHLYVINKLGNSVQLTLRSDVPDNPLSPESALVLAKGERQSRLECEGEREVSEVHDNGTVLLRVLDPSGQETCRVVVGRYTQEVVSDY